ncbi:DUF2809 domain-containing protein [Aureivirga sp. CE67]|uniref:ribosomal maturation YjgA family protein n=1 Tax=Aureivirga sp. CE67 TaxID=1788983 RepID=UPI0018CA80A6|nr:DUF2809 domain-containing protein [Aureivirga sp. CE67]
MKNIQFNIKYFLIFLVIIVVEAIIATFFRGSFIRHVLGDFLVVILLYSFFRAITNFDWKKVAISVLFFAYFVEVLQWVNILKLLNLKKGLMTDLTLGSTFDWKDMLAYTLGIGLVFVLEILKRKQLK